MKKIISVIIPALNEEKTIAKVVEIALSHPLVLEAIVVDDNSGDNTVSEARRAGARVITSEVRGKGLSMKDGLNASRGDVLVFMDADLSSLSLDVVALLADPILQGKADFVKSCFGRSAGRVTELVAKPLVQLFYPELAQFSQPLSGMVAGRKVFFEKVVFETDYGVDVGLLIDMHTAGARIKQVDIGSIGHKMKSWRRLKGMAFQVSRAILKRARTQKKWAVGDLMEIESVRDGLEEALSTEILETKKVCVFDMDGTLSTGRFIVELGTRCGFEKEVLKIMGSEMGGVAKTRKLASLLKGLTPGELLSVARSIPLSHNAIQAVSDLKSLGYGVGIVSDSYQLVADYVKDAVGADFAIANQLEFKNGVATGKVTIPSVWFNKNGCGKKQHEACKYNVLIALANKSGLLLKDFVAVGDNAADSCMIEHAGVGIAYMPKTPALLEVADFVQETEDLGGIVSYLSKSKKEFPSGLVAAGALVGLAAFLLFRNSKYKRF